MDLSSSSGSDSLPLVAVLATGGTIAGRSKSGRGGTNYRSGIVEALALLGDVPGLSLLARLRCRRVATIGSEDMTDRIWLELAQAVAREVADPEVAGVVVLHGTDTMEETAVFLDLLGDGEKPVVMTGAMRPADAVSADGPANILAAIRVAVSAESAGRGVLVVLNDEVHRASRAVKRDTLNVQTFVSQLGIEARMVDGAPVFVRPAVGRADVPRFTATGLKELPRVDIIYGHAGQDRTLVDAALAAGTWGIVYAGVGMGNVHAAVQPALAEAAASGVAVVCASRAGSGPVPVTDVNRRDGFIAAGFLNPQKARVLLRLALTRGGASRRDMQVWFDRYGVS